MKNPLPRIAFAARRQSAAAVLALVAGAALAQAPAPATTPTASGSAQAGAHGRMGHGEMHGDRHGGRHGDRHGDRHAGTGHRTPERAAMQQRLDRHMADLKQSLQLTPAQEPAWNQFTSAMRPAATPPARPDRAAMAGMTTPQRLEQMQAMRQQHQAEMDKRTAAVRSFYATLTPEQQKRFDAQTARAMGGHEGRRGGAHDHHHG